MMFPHETDGLVFSRKRPSSIPVIIYIPLGTSILSVMSSGSITHCPIFPSIRIRDISWYISNPLGGGGTGKQSPSPSYSLKASKFRWSANPASTRRFSAYAKTRALVGRLKGCSARYSSTSSVGFLVSVAAAGVVVLVSMAVTPCGERALRAQLNFGKNLLSKKLLCSGFRTDLYVIYYTAGKVNPTQTLFGKSF